MCWYWLYCPLPSDLFSGLYTCVNFDIHAGVGKEEFRNSYLYAVCKCSANIFTRKISVLCASSPAFIHSVSHRQRYLYKCVGTVYTEIASNCLLISLVSNYLNILLSDRNCCIQSHNHPATIELALMKTY